LKIILNLDSAKISLPQMYSNVINDALKFVFMREKIGGGFSATPLLPATIEDTYYATQILKVCGQTIQKESHKRYLLSQDILGFSPEVLKSYLEILKLMDLIEHISKEKIRQVIHSFKDRGGLEDLKILSSLISIQRILGLEQELLGIPEEFYKDRKNIKIRTVRDVFYAFHIFGMEYGKSFIDFLLKCQNPDGGFGFFKGTTSYMENCFYACYVLNALGVTPKDPKKLMSFILVSRSSDGGFGRNSQGTSFLDTTFFAIWILKTVFGE